MHTLYLQYMDHFASWFVSCSRYASSWHDATWLPTTRNVPSTNARHAYDAWTSWPTTTPTPTWCTWSTRPNATSTPSNGGRSVYATCAAKHATTSSGQYHVLIVCHSLFYFFLFSGDPILYFSFKGVAKAKGWRRWTAPKFLWAWHLETLRCGKFISTWQKG